MLEEQWEASRLEGQFVTSLAVAEAPQFLSYWNKYEHLSFISGKQYHART
jgi:hypothetical protein